MKKTAIIHARIEPATKKRAEDILHRLGLSPTEAVRLSDCPALLLAFMLKTNVPGFGKEQYCSNPLNGAWS